ncbi:unnamed protein product [Parnassius apollo]|uniref:(apollo) hypothetical protein n=1 Tax=Parnassius apollo TaxID=110799 RepID=A0A8S3WUV0_PARAO|nr:unnamed protein product [Parnassius apollo]
MQDKTKGDQIRAGLETDDKGESFEGIVHSDLAYYNSKKFLKYLGVKRKTSNINMNKYNSTMNGTETPVNTEMERNLHIMIDCGEYSHFDRFLQELPSETLS